MVGYRIEREVAVLEVAKPPLNGLTRAVRSGLMEALNRAEEDDAAKVILLTGANGSFPAGVDLAELDAPPDGTSLRDLCERVEYSEKPVVAALGGMVFSGGLELALAAHYRVALETTRFGFFDAHIGLPPSAGGSQRLPRLAGARLALEMLIDGKLVEARSTEGASLVDQVVAKDLRPAALDFCTDLMARGLGPDRLSARLTGGDDPQGFAQEIMQRRAGFTGAMESLEAQVIGLVEASALLPFEAGLEMEAEVYQDFLKGPASRGLRHLYLAEQAAGRIARPSAAPVSIDRVALLGAGPLAVQIAVSLLNAGARVNWAAKDATRLAASKTQLEKLFTGAVRTEGLSQAQADDRLSRLQSGGAEMARGAPLAILANGAFAEAELAPGIHRFAAYPAPVTGVGLRFVPPVYATRLVEVLQGPEATPRDIAMAQALAGKLGKIAVHVTSDGDSLAGRLTQAFQRAADALLDKGLSPHVIDAGLSRMGWPHPPFLLRDRSGVERYARLPRAGGENWSARLLDAGREGRATGAGFYDWTGDKPARSGAVEALLAGHRPAARMMPEEIFELMLGALANEGCRLLAEGKAQSAGDLDVVSVLALDMSRDSGGAMFCTAQRGLFHIQRAMERLDHADRDFWEVHPRWRELVKNGQGFAEF